MRIVANITESMVRLYLIPEKEHAQIREAYENREWLWLVSKWNQFAVTSTRLCATCPDSIAVVKEFFKDLWQESTSTKS